MLRQLARHARRVRRIVVLVLDHGSAQTSRRSEAKLLSLVPQVVVLWLPPYSSEQLNDIENLWQHAKEDYFSEMLVAKGDDSPPPPSIGSSAELRRPGRLRRFLAGTWNELRCPCLRSTARGAGPARPGPAARTLLRAVEVRADEPPPHAPEVDAEVRGRVLVGDRALHRRLGDEAAHELEQREVPPRERAGS